MVTSLLPLYYILYARDLGLANEVDDWVLAERLTLKGKVHKAHSMQWIITLFV